ncbi:hypothetical protein AB0L88_25400 [Saccharopolyspora shandongensis]|uniref:hypothetical protein n=1 Tax=Saccharopolyspora shandongensis TaxID=418495 RepID=UPI003446DF31
MDDVAWRARTRFRAFDGKTWLVERSGPTEKRAVERLESAIEQLQKSQARLTVDFRFRDVAEVWLGKVAQRRAATTRDTYEQTLKSVVLDRIGDLRLREISVPVLEEFFEKLEAEGYSAGYRRSVRTLTTEERRRLFAGMDGFVLDSRCSSGADLPDLVRFLLGTGCHIGEAVAVRWKDVNLTDKPVVVDGTEIPPRSVC